MQIIDNIPIWGSPVDDGALSQIKTCAATAARCALMADGHKGYAVPIGGVVAYEDAISPSGVGFDIGCGNKAVMLDIPAAEVKANIKKIMDDIWTTISFGMGRKNNENVEHSMFDEQLPGWDVGFVRNLKDFARSQLGTVGGGNHYVDILEDENGAVWVAVHFGSRGFGHKIATYFLQEAGAKDGMDVEPCVLEMGTALAADYLAAMELAGKYAYAGRDWVCDRVAKIIGAKQRASVHNHHNFAWQEEHDGKTLWVVRKGATPAFPGQNGFIGGSMATPAYIVQGMDTEEAALSLYSTVHGAGRVMGRMQAKGKWKNGVCVRPGLVTQQDLDGAVEAAHVELRGGGIDESPQCYKDIDNVIMAHNNTVRVLLKLRPLGVAMAGANEADPYKD